ncbi:phosphatase PAP2 family protein [Halogeometricum sp. S1BR25-6]|uniref:Phosphatase PAP2 family protein n=1 Tax=Halogeometricum salsisoli TaxID=2950536 RepID=A0ABU2GAI0_9EURY|nr:phosphatase PAP2 family protein [Halogeometricum sp. S1BR25-6]MDS0297486.1 phosphatase PAP2 family protein [Halogeometricum sp. S1BR25-6]
MTGPPTVAAAAALLPLPLTARGLGELDAAASLPDAVVTLFSVLTHLGNPWVCLFAVCLAYVVGDRAGIARPSAAFLLALGLGAVGLTLGLKTAFALPRPPGAAETGYGFPSGHALGTTVFWGGAALLADAGRRRVRLGVAVAVVAVVAVSRVVLGVHYLADVVAGVAVGALFVAAAVGVGPGLRRPSVPSNRAVVACFLVGGVLAAAAAAADPVEREVLLAVGTAVGGTATWAWLGDTLSGRSAGDALSLSPRSLVVGVLAVPVPLVAMAAVAELPVRSLALAGAGAVGGAALLSLPVAAAALFE